jgi:iron(II)-dependent oxidoreductase
MPRRITVFLLVMTLEAFTVLQFTLWQAASYAQLDPTSQMETVNAVVDQRLTQTAQFLQDIVVTRTIQAVGRLLPAGSQNALWTPQAHDFDDVTMVLVPAGCFMMGTSDETVATLTKETGRNWFNSETPLHEVCITKPFWLDKYEVTQGQFWAKNGKAVKRSIFTGDQRPVERITWYEAHDYCKARGGDLPTEAQWEYAARGPEGREYPWGTWDAHKAVWNRQGTANVGSIPAGASWVGALDMSGNVWEWVGDWYAKRYPNAKEFDPVGPSQGEQRVLRGGSWLSDSSAYLRSAYRIRNSPDNWDINIGFRCARPFSSR